MRALIVEDELMARTRLAKTLEENFPDVKVLAMTDSVRGTLDWLLSNPNPDIIFMDIELTDGDCFEIFRQMEIKSKVVMTTAYDFYALKAFEAGSVDYLLKPISLEALSRAVARCRERTDDGSAEALKSIALASMASKPAFKSRWLVRVGDKFIPIKVSEIAYFFSEEKTNYMVLFDGRHFVMDISLDSLEQQLNPDDFFRISRGIIVSRTAVKSASRYLNGRIKLAVNPASDQEFLVSRSRVDDFMNWLE